MTSSAAGGGGGTSMPAATSAGAGAHAPWLQQQLALARAGLGRVAADLQAASKAWRLPDLSKGLGVKLDVDIFSPALQTARAQYEALPDPLRQVLPYAGVSLLTGLAVGRLHQEQLQHTQLRYGHLRSDYDLVQAQVAQLEAQLNEVNLKRSGAHYELQMAEAVAKAATAAAAAASAAASAATAAAAAAPRYDQPGRRRWQQQEQQRPRHEGRTTGSSSSSRLALAGACAGLSESDDFDDDSSLSGHSSPHKGVVQPVEAATALQQGVDGQGGSSAPSAPTPKKRRFFPPFL